MTEMRTGRLLNHDPRSRAHAFKARVAQPISVLHALNAPALDQGNINACTGFAAAQWLNCSIAKNNRAFYNHVTLDRRQNYLDSSDAYFLYRKATQFDDFSWTFPPIDGGSSGLGVAKALHKLGLIESYSWTFDFDTFLAAVQRQPVLVGTVWPDSLFDPDWFGTIRVTGSLDAGGHEYLVRGVNFRRQMFRIRNSWGAGWGIKGDAYIPFDDMKKLLAAQGDCTVLQVSR